MSGLCLTNQHTSVLFIMPISMVCLLKERKNLSVKLIGTLILYIAMPLSLYLYLPLSSILAKARWSWGDCSTVEGRDRKKQVSEDSEFSKLKKHYQKNVSSPEKKVFLPNPDLRHSHSCFTLRIWNIFTCFWSLKPIYILKLEMEFFFFCCRIWLANTHMLYDICSFLL